MNPLAEKQWNDWAQLLIRRALDEHSDEMVDATAEFVQDMLAPLREEIAALRADLAIYSDIAPMRPLTSSASSVLRENS